MENDSFVRQALIYLAAGVIAVPLFRRLGLGSVLGYLAAGMVIGPWGLQLIPEVETALHVAEFGVVLLLFLIGLELAPARLWELRRAILGMGSVQVLATGLAVGAAALAFGQSGPVALVAGLGFAMSSTAIGLTLLQEKGLLATPGGQASFSVLLFQDLAVVPMLLAVGLLAEGKSAIDWRAALTAVVLIAALLLAGRTLLRPALRYIAEARLREVFVAASLLLVIGVAALMHAVGLSMALGAFLAGMLLADSEYRHELELDIEPFKGLLLGLFFIAVGMALDLGLFMRQPLLVLGLACGLILLKMAILVPVARTFGYCGGADATVFALALSQAGEFAFVLFSAADSFLPPATLALLNATVATSMLLTPLLFLAYERVLAPRFARDSRRGPEVVDEAYPVIVAGYGRFGQVITRVLNGLRIDATLIDHDPNQVETVRRFGSKAYYGDATRMDVLERAGVARARLLIVAINDPAAALRITRQVRASYPQLALIVRAQSRTDAFEYYEMGVPAVRETFGSALDAAGIALRTLGYAPADTQRVLEQFRRHDQEMLERMAPHRGEVKRLIALNQQGRHDLMALLSRESPPQVDQRDAGGDQQRGEREGAA